jgi:hypothetical protein
MGSHNGSDSANFHTIVIQQNGEFKVQFRIRRITLAETYKLWEESQTHKSARKRKLRIKNKTNLPLFLSRVIYEATVEEDRLTTWDNAELQEQYNVATPIHMIGRILTGDAKERVVLQICEFSGIGTDSIADGDLTILAKSIFMQREGKSSE